MQRISLISLSYRLVHTLLSVAIVGSLVAACVIQSAPPPDSPGTEPPAVSNPGQIDCSSEPEGVMCCQSNQPECTQCRQQAADTLTAWQAACVPASTPIVDCQTPPETMCCQADTAECAQCRADATAERQLWAQTCGGEASLPTPPSTPTVNCSEPPGRMCCAAQTETCINCRAQAEAERLAWEQQCSGQ